MVEKQRDQRRKLVSKRRNYYKKASTIVRMNQNEIGNNQWLNRRGEIGMSRVIMDNQKKFIKGEMEKTTGNEKQKSTRQPNLQTMKKTEKAKKKRSPRWSKVTATTKMSSLTSY